MKVKQPSGLVMRGPFKCECEVRKNGYEWDTRLRPVSERPLKENDSQASLWLVDGFVDGVVFDSYRFQPLYDPELHRQFGSLKPTREAMKKFADRCGLLGNSVFLYYPDQEGQPQTPKTGESFEFWKQEIEKMSALIDL